MFVLTSVPTNQEPKELFFLVTSKLPFPSWELLLRFGPTFYPRGGSLHCFCLDATEIYDSVYLTPPNFILSAQFTQLNSESNVPTTRSTNLNSNHHYLLILKLSREIEK
jgi:hypothetical protein